MRTPRPHLPAIILAGVFVAVAAARIGLIPETWGRPFEQTLLAAADLQSRLVPAADGSARRVARLDDGSQLLGRFAARGRLNAHSDSYRSARALLPERFADYESKRFIVLSDGHPRWSRRQAELLDRTYHQFHRFTRQTGLKPRPLRHKLVCVLFEQHEDYQRFARTHDGVTADWISGYYSPMNDRIVFYNIETNPAFADTLGSRTSMQGSHLASNRIANDFTKAATATTVHEAIHQLAFHTRVQSPHIQNPLWISEGLATAFETDKTNKTFGPDHDYAPRRKQFVTLLNDDQLIPLRTLVGYTQMPNNDDDTITVVYHQSYALVTWLSRQRRAQLREFFTALANETPGRPSSRRHLQIFENSFGDVETLERVWMRSERNRGKK